MSNCKSALLFYFRATFVIITAIFLIIPISSCDIGARKYADVICNYSHEYNVEPALVFAIIETESHFNSRAVSSVGAIGIMQIMPQTGDWIATSLSIESFNDDMLFDPELNIRFGTWYLAYLTTVFDEKWQIICAYNAGEGSVRRWIEELSVTRDGIPIHETAAYLTKVERAQSRFRRKKYASFD